MKDMLLKKPEIAAYASAVAIFKSVFSASSCFICCTMRDSSSVMLLPSHTAAVAYTQLEAVAYTQLDSSSVMLLPSHTAASCV